MGMGLQGSQEEKLQNKGSRGSLSFSTYLDKTAELGVVSETFPERSPPAAGAFQGTSPTSTHACFGGLTSITVLKLETRMLF